MTKSRSRCQLGRSLWAYGLIALALVALALCAISSNATDSGADGLVPVRAGDAVAPAVLSSEASDIPGADGSHVRSVASHRIMGRIVCSDVTAVLLLCESRVVGATTTAVDGRFVCPIAETAYDITVRATLAGKTFEWSFVRRAADTRADWDLGDLRPVENRKTLALRVLASPLIVGCMIATRQKVVTAVLRVSSEHGAEIGRADFDLRDFGPAWDRTIPLTVATPNPGDRVVVLWLTRPESQARESPTNLLKRDVVAAVGGEDVATLALTEDRCVFGYLKYSNGLPCSGAEIESYDGEGVAMLRSGRKGEFVFGGDGLSSTLTTADHDGWSESQVVQRGRMTEVLLGRPGVWMFALDEVGERLHSFAARMDCELDYGRDGVVADGERGWHDAVDGRLAIPLHLARVGTRVLLQTSDARRFVCTMEQGAGNGVSVSLLNALPSAQLIVKSGRQLQLAGGERWLVLTEQTGSVVVRVRLGDRSETVLEGVPVGTYDWEVVGVGVRDSGRVRVSRESTTLNLGKGS